jgi:hypothetical protein
LDRDLMVVVALAVQGHPIDAQVVVVVQVA